MTELQESARVWTIYVCPGCGRFGVEQQACCVKERKPGGRIELHVREPVEVIPKEAA